MSRFAAATIGLLIAVVAAHAEPGMQHGGPLLYYVQAERLEFHDAADEVFWDLDAWYGSDLHKLWIKSEGHANGSGDAELQVLYSRARTAFFDLQFGMRVSDIDDGDIVSGVAGIYGMAPYRIEVDAALSVSEHGDVTLRAEAERDIFLTEQTILQPRIEVDIALQDAPEFGVGSGLSAASIGLRLRHEVTRKFAPYVGVDHERLFGDTADFIRTNGGDAHETSIVAGIRFWF